MSEPFVIAGRVVLLALAAAATLWAFAFSGGHGHTAPPPAAHAHHGGQQNHSEHHQHHDGHEVAPTAADQKLIGAVERRVFALEARAPAWIDADGVVTAVLRKDGFGGLLPGERAEFFRALSPGNASVVRLAAAAPQPWDEATVTLRFRLEGRDAGLRHSDVGWVRLAARSRELLVVPSAAVLYSAEGPYVLALGADGRDFDRRRVQIGSVSRGLAVVLAGLRDGEPIAVGGAFSLDAERRLRLRNEDMCRGAE